MDQDTGLVTPVRTYAGTKVYQYQLFAPSSWFKKED